MPTGERKNGKPLYLDELYIDSPRMATIRTRGGITFL